MSDEQIRGGDTIKAGTLVVLTFGEYDDFGVVGLYRADVDVVVPSRRKRGRVPHLGKLVGMLAPVPHLELWGDW